MASLLSPSTSSTTTSPRRSQPLKSTTLRPPQLLLRPRPRPTPTRTSFYTICRPSSTSLCSIPPRSRSPSRCISPTSSTTSSGRSHPISRWPSMPASARFLSSSRTSPPIANFFSPPRPRSCRTFHPRPGSSPYHGQQSLSGSSPSSSPSSPATRNILWFSGGQAGISLDPRDYSDPSVLQSVLRPDRARPHLCLSNSTPAASPVAPQLPCSISRCVKSPTTPVGEPFYNRNGLAQAAAKILASDNSFYTLVFSPQNFHPDNKWHQVKVRVEGGNYQLSYQVAATLPATVTTSGSPSPTTAAEPSCSPAARQEIFPADLHSSPIIFTASIVPRPAIHHPHPARSSTHSATTPLPKRRQTPTRSSTPFPRRPRDPHFDRRPRERFLQGRRPWLQYDRRTGRRKGRSRLRQIPPRRPAHAGRHVAQNVGLPRGDLFLYIAVWDLTTGRTGTLQIPFTAP